MSDFGVEPDDMTNTVMVDDKLDALLAGRATAPGDELAAELSQMLGQLHHAFPSVVVSEQVEDVHVARMMEAAAGLSVVETTVTVASHTPLLERIRTGLSRRVAVATLALTTAFGGAAYAGVLPGPIQRGVAELAAMVGLDLPHGDHGADKRLPVTDGDEGGDGAHGTEREQESNSFGRTVGEGPRDGDMEPGGVHSEDLDERHDSDSDSDDGEEDRETDDNDSESNDGDEENETDDNEIDDLPEQDDEPDGGDSGEAEEPDSEDSADSSDEVKDEDEIEEPSDPGLGSEDAEADSIEAQDSVN